QVSNFAVEAITRAQTMSFANYRDDLAEASQYFTRPDGWNNYLAALKSSGTMELIEKRRIVSTAVANGATIVRSGVDSSGYYTWLVQVPMTITHQTSSETSKSNILAEILISRMPTWQMPRGIGIKQVVMRAGR
ncbi:DotI/IcmL/TraM family protein, partial [Marinobacter alexandrii]